MVRSFALWLTAATGFSGLVYEGAWQMYLATLLGSHSEATAAVIGLFLGGLAIGYGRLGALTRRRLLPPRDAVPARQRGSRLGPLRGRAAAWRWLTRVEAAPGFEPGIRALQAHALPLGYAAARKPASRGERERVPRAHG